MSRKNKRNADPRSNHGKYASDDARKPGESKGNTQASKDANPKQPGITNDAKDTNTSSDSKFVPPNHDPNSTTGARSANNDPEWYAKDAQLVIDAASLPYSEPLGSEVMLQTPNELYASDGVNGQTYAVASPKGEAIPGILTAFTKSTFGSNRYAQDPANVAANALYTHVRYVNSGRKNYDPADLFMYVSSMADVFSFVMWAQRTYAKAFIYSQRNKYVGKALLQAEHIDHDNIVLGLANFRYWLNTFINKVSSFAVPASIAYFQRRAWMYAHVYLENPDANIKDQLYQFAPDGFYRFELDYAGVGMLQYKTIAEILGHNNPLTINDFVTIGDYLLANITGDEDFGLMSGDVLKAFNGDIIGIASVPEVVDLLPVYSEYVLLQFKNATVIDICRGTTNNYDYDLQSNGVVNYLGNVYQTPDGNIMSLEGINSDNTKTGTAQLVSVGMRKVFTLKTPTPTPVDTMEISRLSLGGMGILALTGHSPVLKVSCGADVVTNVNVSKFSWDSNGNWVYTESAYNSSAFDNNYITNNANKVIDIERFKYAPMLYGFDITTSGGIDYINELRVLNDVDNYTIVDWRVLARLHEVALLSMLWVPGVAKVVNY